LKGLQRLLRHGSPTPGKKSCCSARSSRIHWPAVTPLRADGPEGIRRQYQALAGWEGLEVEPISVRVFVPAGHAWPIDPPEFREFRLPVSFLNAGDWALLLNADLITEPRGRLIDEPTGKLPRPVGFGRSVIAPGGQT